MPDTSNPEVPLIGSPYDLRVSLGERVGETDNPKVRVQICEDDFLLKPEDITCFRSTFVTNLTAYPTGGHLGNLHVTAVQEALVCLFPPALAGQEPLR